MVLEKMDCEIAGMTAATRRERLEAKPPAIIFGTYPMSSTALRTLLAVRSFSFSGELKNRDTVAVDTPAAAATSSMVTLLGGGRGRALRRERGLLAFARLDTGISAPV